MGILKGLPGLVIVIVASIAILAVFMFSTTGTGKMVKATSDKATNTMTSTLDTLDGKISGAAGALN